VGESEVQVAPLGKGREYRGSHRMVKRSEEKKNLGRKGEAILRWYI
jgi:hypothetical protein